MIPLTNLKLDIKSSYIAFICIFLSLFPFKRFLSLNFLVGSRKALDTQWWNKVGSHLEGVSEKVTEFGEQWGLISTVTENGGWAGAWRTGKRCEICHSRAGEKDTIWDVKGKSGVKRWELSWGATSVIGPLSYFAPRHTHLFRFVLQAPSFHRVN